jgi:sterol desaturase/sphingolipid hydroxylase (fatty acid hydroxylase superfamily)
MVTLIVLLVGLAMLAVETAAPGRRWPRVANWWLRAVLSNGVQAGAVFLAGVAWDGWMLRHRPWSADWLGPWAGAILGYLAMTLVYYWWHRWRHRSELLWRWLHQVHHSPQRVEILTTFYKHPLEIVCNAVLSSAIAYFGVGLGPQAASGAMLLSGVAELVYHWNVRTPRWIGFLFQQPESHCVHYEEGVHSYNYSDLPLWDMLFGTFRNPSAWERRCGFGPEGEHRLVEMLRGADVSRLSAPSPR